MECLIRQYEHFMCKDLTKYFFRLLNSVAHKKATSPSDLLHASVAEK